MKKIVFVGLILTLILSFTGCTDEGCKEFLGDDKVDEVVYDFVDEFYGFDFMSEGWHKEVKTFLNRHDPSQPDSLVYFTKGEQEVSFYHSAAGKVVIANVFVELDQHPRFEENFKLITGIWWLRCASWSDVEQNQGLLIEDGFILYSNRFD